MTSIVEEMGEMLVRSSYSPNIKERRDCSTVIFDADGNAMCQAAHIPGHFGCFLEFIPAIYKFFPRNKIRPGDVFVGNDAYEGGVTHLNDITFASPVFIGETLFAWVMNCGHHCDFADRGGAHIFQEGLRIPPVRFYREGALQEDVQSLILLNCQVPEERAADFRAQIAANRLGEARLRSLCEKYGVEIVRSVSNELQDYAERRVRAGIRNIPNGVYHFGDNFERSNYPEFMDFSLTMTVHDDSLDFHFDSPPQVRAGINVVYTALLGAVYFAVRAMIDAGIPPNSGMDRAINVTAAKGTVLNCELPAAVSGRMAASQRVVELVFGAFAEAVPERIIAGSNGAGFFSFSGVKHNKMWAYAETVGGGSGARATKDGLDGVHVHLTNTSNLPIEALETEYPISVLRYELVDGSAGPGRHRGGMALRRVYRVEDTCRANVGGSRMRTQPWGFQGGRNGAAGSFSVKKDGQQSEVTHNAPNPAEYHKGDVLELVTAGAGGYGPPNEREAAAIARDIREGVISAADAKQIYNYPR
ncbi:hydantoinase B/oxoprolinase family protein [Bradyrhizobium sp. BWA-3-5]|uniref:hydantoinase B/oxoprolinase family protein n=1 Tax=Bradyrhizobium sp. BWA-3-5 TaxID=3080013 RepID=UPI00293E544C|nr:hydantoinase B/oxoprolinase family protein [Bradyrhizobium sp. BWA-3-5]WOH63724.1 hydantoinase B/oxoprolinase family protein [Bradyrhizobium sp. BWA-3-5]